MKHLIGRVLVTIGMLPALRALMVFTALSAFSLSASGAARLPVPSHMATPLQLLNALYLDVAGLLGPELSQPPLWWSHLSERTKALHDRLNELDDASGQKTFDYDWLCQCRNRRYLKVPTRMSTEHASATDASVTVQMQFHGHVRQTIHLLLVYEEGWKIDDIINEAGFHFRDELQRSIGHHGSGERRLPKQLP